MPDKRELWAFLACRNKGSRLWGKPLQNLCIENQISILDYLIKGLKECSEITGVVLGIAEGVENEVFQEYADRHNLKFIVGDENDVLGRLVKCFTVCTATDALRITPECPFPALEYIEGGWASHIEKSADMTCLDHVPDGCGFEIINKVALENSHLSGESRHQSELCTLYIRENKDTHIIEYIEPESKDKRPDLRLTVDYPEDLVVCRAVFDELCSGGNSHPALGKIIDFVETQPQLIELVDGFVEEAMKTMYR